MAPLAPEVREGSNAAWTVVGQCLSSLTNFGGSVLAARALGVDFFGAFTVGFAVYLLALGLSRALSIEPMMIRYSAASTTDARNAIARAGGSALGVGAALGGVLVTAGFVIGGSVGGVLLVAAVALPCLLLHDVCRSALIMTRRARAAAVNDGVWLTVMSVSFLVLPLTGSRSATAFGAWASGAVVASAVGVFQLGTRPQLAIWSWWIEHRDLGLRYVGEFMTTVGVSYTLLLVVAIDAGAADTSGVRGVQVLMGPMNILFMAASSFSLPLLVRRLSSAAVRPGRVTTLVSLICAGSATLWALFVLFLPDSVGRALLGESWAISRDVLPFLAAAMVAEGVALGPMIGLRALADARRSFRLRLAIAPFSIFTGIVGIVVADAVGLVATVALVQTIAAPFWWRSYRRSRDSLTMSHPINRQLA
jgi:O-antigen/teichoic acid export membrane protein